MDPISKIIDAIITMNDVEDDDKNEKKRRLSQTDEVKGVLVIHKQTLSYGF